MKVMSVEAGENASAEYDFLGVPPEATENIFGLEAYLDRYGQCEADGPSFRQHPEEFEDFCLACLSHVGQSEACVAPKIEIVRTQHASADPNAAPSAAFQCA